MIRIDKTIDIYNRHKDLLSGKKGELMRAYLNKLPSVDDRREFQQLAWEISRSEKFINFVDVIRLRNTLMKHFDPFDWQFHFYFSKILLKSMGEDPLSSDFDKNSLRNPESSFENFILNEIKYFDLRGDN
jgi:hypothetical protein